MIIGIDGNEANQKIRVGSGVYSFELLWQFEKSQISNLKYQIYLKDPPISDLPKESARWKYIVPGPKKLWTQIGLPIELWKEKIFRIAPDVFFSPTHYAPRFCPVPSVITIFDLAFVRFPKMFLKKDLWQLKKWTEYSVRQAKKIITISEFSKKEIVDYYKVDSDKVIVAYPGYNTEKFRIQNSEFRIKNVKNKYKIVGEYILYIGTIQPRKNLKRLIETFCRLKSELQCYSSSEQSESRSSRQARTIITPDLKLVIAGMIDEGRGGWMSDEILHQTQNSKLKTQSDIIITGFINDKDLPYLTAGAKVFVLPSLYEGFGIPVIEAMATGIPVVVSNTSSLPEVVGKAGILVDPYDAGSISEGIKEACYNKSRWEELIKNGLEQVKKFSWEKSANTVLDKLVNL